MASSKSSQSDRSFALLTGVFLLGLVLLLFLLFGRFFFLSYLILTLGSLVFITALLSPDYFKRPDPVPSLWLHFGHTLHQITTPLVLAIVFYGCFVPIGFLLKMIGKDPLTRELNTSASSYWIKRDPPGPGKESIKMQF